jgi:hypothetical protein
VVTGILSGSIVLVYENMGRLMKIPEPNRLIYIGDIWVMG